MFDKLKTIFSLKRNPSENTNQSSRNSNILSDRDEIISLLFDIKESMPTCTVLLSRKRSSYSSAILEINSADNIITLDKFKPELDDVQLQSCDTVKVLFYYDGDEVYFNLTRLRQLGNSDYQFSIPNKIYYPNKANHRALDVLLLKVPFDGFSASGRFPVSGHVNDIAEAHISAYISTNNAILERSDLLKDCHIILPGKKHLVTFDLIIKIVKRPIAKNAKTFLSGEIKNMSAPDRIQYEHFMATVERQEIQKHK